MSNNLYIITAPSGAGNTTLIKRVFISPPSVDELRKRLMERGLDSEDVINRRIEGAQLEMDKSNHFKHQITNISLDIATKNLLNIMFRENHG